MPIFRCSTRSKDLISSNGMVTFAMRGNDHAPAIAPIVQRADGVASAGLRCQRAASSEAGLRYAAKTGSP